MLTEEILMTAFTCEGGGSLAVDTLFIDSGDEAMEIYDWAAQYLGYVWPTKGIDFLPEIIRIKRLDKDDPKKKRRRRKNLAGLELIEIGTNELKDKMAASLEKDIGAIDSTEFYAEISPHILSQICGEHKVKERRRGHLVGVWKPKRQHGDVHFWDTLILTEAAGYKKKALLLRGEDEPARLPAAMQNKTTRKERVRMSAIERRRV
jgi:phage terminase large subunit GpA-like protein